MEVASRLEPKSQVNKINNAFDVLLEQEKQGDLQYVMEYLFTEVMFGEENVSNELRLLEKIVRLLECSKQFIRI